MNSLKNNAFEITAKILFNDLFNKEYKNMTTNEIDLNNDILGKKNDCLSIPNHVFYLN
jgi:hypothetical protein